MKFHNVRLWLRIVVCFILPLVYYVIQSYHEGENITLLFWMLLLGISAFYIASIYLEVHEEELHLKLLFPQKVILRKIPFKNMLSIDAHKVLWTEMFFIRLKPQTNNDTSRLGLLMGMSDSNIGLNPFMGNKSKLIKLILKKNTSIEIDKNTEIYLSKFSGD